MARGRSCFLLAAAAAGLLASPGLAGAQTPTAAQAELRRADGTVAGSVTMSESTGTVRVTAQLSGLPPGWHGFHVHTTGSCVPPTFTSAGGHFNPSGAPHAEHAGDMPLLYAAADGTAVASFATDRFRIADLFDSDGAAVIVHAAADNHANIPPDRYEPDPDATTLATGDAGSRLACGALSLYTPPPPPPIPAPPPPHATAVLTSTTGAVVGSVELRVQGGKVEVSGDLRGLPAGFHGFHMHATASCRRPSFISAGGHLNPANASHPGHAGDMPFVYATGDGTASFEFVTDRFRLSDLFDADGSAIIVHASADNYANIPPDRYDPDPDATTLSTGDAGSRLACGVVWRRARCSVTVRPRTLRAGVRTVVRLTVSPPATAIFIEGAGLRRNAGARDPRQRWAIPIRPRRPGTLRFSVIPGATTLGCAATRRVIARRGGLGASLTARVA